jgi:hypothetical protein
MILRCLLLTYALWLLAPHGASSQEAWSTTLPIVADHRVQLRDAVALADGNWLAVAQTDNISGSHVLRAQSWTALMDPTGQIIGISPLAQEGRYIAGNAIVEHAADGSLHLVSVGWDSLTATGYGVSQFLFNPEGILLGDTHTLFGDGTYEFTFNNAVLDRAGVLLVLGSAFIEQPLYPLPNKALLMRVGLDGQPMEQWYSGPDIASTASHAILVHDGILVAFIGSVGVGPFGNYRFLRFTDELHYVDGFAGTSVSGTGSISPPDSSLRDGLFMTPSGNESFIVSGRYGYVTATGHRSAILRIASDGQQEAAFLPYGGTHHESCGMLQSHDHVGNGKVVFAAVENFSPQLPDVMSSTQPSRVRVYLLDSMLNVLCEQLVDGYEDGSYYFVNRVKATPDGGTLMMGTGLTPYESDNVVWSM